MKKITLASIATIFLIIVVFLVAVYGFGFMQRETADFRGETGQIEKTKANSNFRIASYDSFYDTCASVQSLESKIINMQEELEGTEETQRKTILIASVTASKNKRAELITRYNADARKEATQGQFRASDLPYQLNEEEERTECEIY